MRQSLTNADASPKQLGYAVRNTWCVLLQSLLIAPVARLDRALTFGAKATGSSPVGRANRILCRSLPKLNLGWHQSSAYWLEHPDSNGEIKCRPNGI